MRLTLLSGLLMIGVVASCAAPSDAPQASAPARTTNVVLASALDDSPSPARSPATQPTAPVANSAAGMQLPAGHPDISGGASPATQPGADALPALPKGHPDISAMMGGAGTGAGAGGAGQLPAGHPDISTLMGGPNSAATTTSLTIKAVQATIGGPPVGANTATVQIYDRDRVISKLEAKLNEQGEATLSGIPVGSTYQPLVSIDYAGVAYEAIGEPISAAPQTVTVRVYEPTEQPVGWEVRMRHIMLQPTAEGVQVIDMLAIDNATDRAYVGAAAADGSRSTFALPIPAGAKDVKFIEGFHDCCTRVENGKVINTMAIVPGTTQYQLMYFVPLSQGQAEITAVAPATTKHFIVFAPDDGTTITGSGLEAGTTNMGNGTTRYFKANSVAADQPVKLVVSGTPTRGAAASGGSPRASGGAGVDAAQLAKTVAGLGALLIFLIGGAMFFRRPGSNILKNQPKSA